MTKGKTIQYDFCKAQVIKSLAKDFSKTESYIRGILNETYKPAIADDVKKGYRDRYEKIKNALQ